MDRPTLDRITLHVVGACALLAVAAFAFGGASMGFGALAGGALAVANWFAMRWVGRRLMVANDHGRLVWGVILATKMMALLGIVWAVLSTGLVDPTGFAVGLGGLVLGVLTGTFHGAVQRPTEGAPTPTEEQS